MSLVLCIETASTAVTPFTIRWVARHGEGRACRRRRKTDDTNFPSLQWHYDLILTMALELPLGRTEGLER